MRPAVPPPCRQNSHGTASRAWIRAFRFPAWKLPLLCSDLGKLNLGLDLASRPHLFHLAHSLPCVSARPQITHRPPRGKVWARSRANAVRAGLVGSAGGPALPSHLLAVNRPEILNPLVSQRLHLCCVHRPLRTVLQSSLDLRSLSPARVLGTAGWCKAVLSTTWLFNTTTGRAGFLCNSLSGFFSYQDKSSSDLGNKRVIIFWRLHKYFQHPGK